MTKFVSFARNMEDVLLRRALRDIDHGFYIDLGAAEADMNSVTRGFYEAGWNGINIGTDRRGIERLARRLRDVSLLADQTAEGMSFARSARKTVWQARTGSSMFHPARRCIS